MPIASPGSLQSKGWAMGEVNERDVLHKGRLFLDGATGARGKSMALWTASSLSKYVRAKKRPSEKGSSAKGWGGRSGLQESEAAQKTIYSAEAQT